MRIVAFILIALLCSLSASTGAYAQQPNACKQCSDQQNVCLSNYSAKTCKTEYDICIKTCKKQ